MYAVTVTIKVVEDHMEAFLPLMLENAAASRAEPGCRQFDVCTDPEQMDEVFLYEIYDDKAAFDVHLGTPHFTAFRLASQPHIESMTLRTFAEVVQ